MATSGIPYFPLDCQLDTKFGLLEAEFGLKGFAIVVKLFQHIYGGEGYYCEWNKEVGLLFSKNVGESCGLVSEICSAAVRRGIFSQELFEAYGILTSKGIQVRYFEAAKKRKKISVKREYLLVPCGQIPKNADIPAENAGILQEKDSFSEQRKEKETKEKQRKEEERNRLENPNVCSDSSGARPPSPAKEEKKPLRIKYGEYGWVLLSQEEYSRLIEEYGEETAAHYIRYVDESAQQSGNKNKWKDWNLVVRKAIRGQWGEGKTAAGPRMSAGMERKTEETKAHSYDLELLELLAVNRPRAPQ